MKSVPETRRAISSGTSGGDGCLDRSFHVSSTRVPGKRKRDGDRRQGT